jgi:hypothetical protein
MGIPVRMRFDDQTWFYDSVHTDPQGRKWYGFRPGSKFAPIQVWVWDFTQFIRKQSRCTTKLRLADDGTFLDFPFPMA